jgi:hypothetical protein
MFYTVDYIV